MRLRNCRLQLGHGRGIGLELLTLLDTEWEEHAHHLEVFGLRRLFCLFWLPTSP